MHSLSVLFYQNCYVDQNKYEIIHFRPNKFKKFYAKTRKY